MKALRASRAPLAAAVLVFTVCSAPAQLLSDRAAAAGFPDAPTPAGMAVAGFTGESSSAAGVQPIWTASLDPALVDGGFTRPGVQTGANEMVPLSQCPFDKTGARECRVHWHQLLIEASVYDAFQNAGNLYTGYWYRYETMHGKWMQRWFDSVLGWRWTSWSDNNPLLDDYVGHPMMGSITNYLWIQNDPKGMTLEFSNTRPYWRSRLRAMAFSTAFSLQWKFGPFGEAAIGHNGDHFFYDKRVLTNETGWVELVTTPAGGLGWTVVEDVVDKHLRHFEERPHKPLTLLAVSLLTPSKATANILRFRPPWYHDGYTVKAASFWSDPPGTRPTGDRPAAEIAPGDIVASGAAVQPASGEQLPRWPHYGGVHEFGAWWGVSLLSTNLWGTTNDIRYMPIELNYSYLLNRSADRVSYLLKRSADRVQFRYEPELVALAMVDQPNPGGKTRYLKRTRTYGAGLSPAGLRMSFLPNRPVEPFFSAHGGFLGFTDPVLGPKGSQYLSTVDFGGGLTFFRKLRQSVSVGYRYQHLASTTGSASTDANTVYVQISRFRTKGYR